MCATNRPDMLDAGETRHLDSERFLFLPTILYYTYVYIADKCVVVLALLRPGRIDRKVLNTYFCCWLPCMCVVFNVALTCDCKIYVPPPDADSRHQIISNALSKIPHEPAAVDVPALVLRSAGFSGAEVAAICSEACMLAVEEGALALTAKHLDTAMTGIKPQITETMLKFYKSIQLEFLS